MNENAEIKQIESQVQHIMNMYEDEELEEMFIDLCANWYTKGIAKGALHVVSQLKDRK